MDKEVSVSMSCGTSGHYYMDSLRNYEAFTDSLRCFDWLPEEVSGASDIDLMLERRGRILVIEGKKRSGPELYVPLGQFIALKTLASKPGVDVFLVAEDEQAKANPTKPHYALVPVAGLKPDRDGLKHGLKHAVFFTDIRWSHLSLEGLRAEVRAWWDAQ